MNDIVTAVLGFDPDPVLVASGNLRPRNNTAIQEGVDALISTLLTLSEEEVRQIVTLPVYLIDAIRISSYKDRAVIKRQLSSCLTTVEVSELNQVDRQLSDAYIEACYGAFYYNESPGKVQHRIAEETQFQSVGFRFLVDEARRVKLKILCSECVSNSSAGDVVSILFEIGIRTKTIMELAEIAGKPCRSNYDNLRRRWTKYCGERVRGAPTLDLPLDMVEFFNERLDVHMRENECPYRAAFDTYMDVAKKFGINDIFNKEYRLDSFVTAYMRTGRKKKRAA